ncbi:hypothetical protein [Levilactobacillus fujinensis]|uniref:EF-hand domain-containing protein n=1 Tax=Levilactobacillus fujinensis TaxID=2486024 RepID=A0ABW1TDM7_9LACO|nr:hypothetical protein [Levilactobacillus fujinensis]
MATTVIVYNQPEQQFLNQTFDGNTPAKVDLSSIGLSNDAEIGKLVQADTFALVFDGTTWINQTYMQWEDLRINEALQAVKVDYSEKTQGILTRFVASMDIKYQGKMSWVELLNKLGKEIEE